MWSVGGHNTDSRALTDLYAKYFAPKGAEREDGSIDPWWLLPRFHNMNDKETAEFRVTALLLFAAMVEAGDA